MMGSSARVAGDMIVAWGQYATCTNAAVIHTITDVVHVRQPACAARLDPEQCNVTVDTTREAIPFDIHICSVLIHLEEDMHGDLNRKRMTVWFMQSTNTFV